MYRDNFFPAILSNHHATGEKGHDKEWKPGTITANNLPPRETRTSFLLSGCISQGLQIVVLVTWGGTSFGMAVIPGMLNSFSAFQNQEESGFWLLMSSYFFFRFHRPASSWYMASVVLFDTFQWCHILELVTRREIYKNISWNLSFSYFREDKSCSTILNVYLGLHWLANGLYML